MSGDVPGDVPGDVSGDAKLCLHEQVRLNLAIRRKRSCTKQKNLKKPKATCFGFLPGAKISKICVSGKKNIFSTTKNPNLLLKILLARFFENLFQKALILYFITSHFS